MPSRASPHRGNPLDRPTGLPRRTGGGRIKGHRSSVGLAHHAREVRMRAILPRRVVLIAATMTLFSASAGWASTSTVDALQQVSGGSPFADCTADNIAAQPGTVYPNSEVEPWVAASTVDLNADGASDIIAGHQQDRWSNGGSRGVYASVWHQGVWKQVAIPGT